MKSINTRRKNKIQNGGKSEKKSPLYYILKFLRKTDVVATKAAGASFWEIMESKLIADAKINYPAYFYKALVLFFISIVVFLLLLRKFFEKFDIPGGSFIDMIVNKDVLHIAYSICRIVNLLFTLMIVVFCAAKVTKLNNKVNIPIPFPILLVGYFISVIPYAYDLLTLVSASSIVLMIYSFFCGGKKANTWSLISLVENSMLMVGLFGFGVIFIYYIIMSVYAKTTGSNEGVFESIIGRILLLSSITFVVLNTLTQLFESMISYNASFWAGLNSENSDSNSNLNNDCVSSNKETEENLKKKNPSLEILLNVILSGGIVIYLIVMTIIGMIPYPKFWVVGDQIRATSNIFSKLGLKFTLTPIGGFTEQKNAGDASPIQSGPIAGTTYR